MLFMDSIGRKRQKPYHTGAAEYLQELVSVDDGSGDSINTATISVIYPDQEDGSASQ